MNQTTRVLAAALMGLAVAPAVGQTIFSPSQSELLGLAFTDFIDNVEPDMAALQNLVAEGTDGVRATFKTDYDQNDLLYRVALEAPITADLSGLDAFSLTFSDPFFAPAGVSIGAQIFVRSVGGSSFANNGQIINLGSSPSTISIPTDRIIDLGGDPSDITSFGIEFFGGDEFLGALDGAMATISTSPQPPTLVDNVLYSWEDGTDPQGWGHSAINETSHDHVVTPGSLGATDGSNALHITRHATGSTFSWGTMNQLDAFADFVPAVGDYNNNGAVDAADYTVWRDNNGAAFDLPNRDPANTGNVGQDDYNTWSASFGDEATGGADPEVQAQITELAQAINDPDAYAIAFDITIPASFNQLPDWTTIHLAIQTDNGWFQNDQGAVPFSAIGADEPVTVQLLLTDFSRASDGETLTDVGLNESSGYLTFHLASNFGMGGTAITDDYEFIIDNFRIQSIAPEPAAVPEPSAVALLGLCLAGAWKGGRRRV